MIYITGDMHGDFTRWKEIKKVGLKKNDTLLICGDFGFIWNNDKKEKHILKKIGKSRFNVAFVDGCYENHEILNQYQEVQFKGALAKKISGNLYSLKRGEVYDFDGKTVFAFGGGDSKQKMDNGGLTGLELPTNEEISRGFENLEKHRNKVDIVLTHDAPIRIRQFLEMDNNEVTQLHTFLEEVSKKVKFNAWYMGKYHVNRKIPPYYYIVYNDINKFEK